MSSNILTFTCIGTDASALTALHRHLTAAIGQNSEQWPEPLLACFEDWESPFVTSTSLRGETLRFVLDSSSGDELEKSHLQALHAAGATHVRVRTWYGQVAETRTAYFSAAKKVAAKAFPTPTMTPEEQLLELLLDGKEAPFVKAIKDGASPDAVVDGKPLLVHACKAQLGKAVQALFAAGVDPVACLAWIDDVADAINSHGGKKTPALLRQLVEAPQADPAALWRSRQLLFALCEHPELLEVLASREGVDVNAQIPSPRDPKELWGSLLFDSVNVFKDKPEVLAVLEKFGARSVPPPTMSDSRRLERLFWSERDAGTIAELAVAGVNLDVPLWEDRSISLLRHLLRSSMRGVRELTLANELLAAGASADFWMDPHAFQQEVRGIFDGQDRLRFAGIELAMNDRPFEPERDGGLIVEFMAGLLARGLDASMTVTLRLMKLKSHGRDWDYRYSPHRWQGPLIGAVALFLCGRGTELRSICVPLVELLIRHGASPDVAGELLERRPDEHLWDLHLHGDGTVEDWINHPATGTVRERLRQRQAAAPDEIDAALLALMDRAGV